MSTIPTPKFAPDATIADDPALLELMIKDAQDQQSIYRPGPYWTGYSRRIQREIEASGLQRFRGKVNIGKGFADVLRVDPLELRGASRSPRSVVTESLLRAFRKVPGVGRAFTRRYLEQIEFYVGEFMRMRDLHYSLLYGDVYEETKARVGAIETGLGEPTDVVNVRGDRVGLTYLKAALRLASFERVANFRSCSSFFEIGGGFGATTDLVFRLHPNVRKVVYLDIQPNLYIGTQYLKALHGDAVRDYRETRKLSNIRFERAPSELEILAVAPWQVEALRVEVDIVYNTESFVEMPLETVRNYARHIGRLLRDRDGEICLWFYDDRGSPRTLDPETVRAEIEQATGARLREFEPAFTLEDGSVWMHGARGPA